MDIIWTSLIRGLGTLLELKDKRAKHIEQPFQQIQALNLVTVSNLWHAMAVIT